MPLIYIAVGAAGVWLFGRAADEVGNGAMKLAIAGGAAYLLAKHAKII